MKTKLAIALLALIAGLAAPAAAGTVNITGTWRLTVTIPGSSATDTIDMIIEAVGQGISVRWTAGGTEYKGEGRIEGQAIEWTMKDTQGGAVVEFLFKGTIVETNGTVTMSGDFGRAEGGERTAWKAARAS
jgi:hypothetical protein